MADWYENMHDILEESWAYQEMVRKGLLEGIKQGRKEGHQWVLRLFAVPFHC